MLTAKQARIAIRKAKIVYGSVMPAALYGDPIRVRISKRNALDMLIGIDDDEETYVQIGPVECGWDEGTVLVH